VPLYGGIREFPERWTCVGPPEHRSTPQKDQKALSKKRLWPPRLLELRQSIAALKRDESERGA
jgi:hypothetical protein